MTTAQIIFTALLMLSSIALIISVLLQKGDEDGMSALTGGGGSSSYFGKNKNRTLEGKLAQATKVLAAIFVVLAMVLIFV